MTGLKFFFVSITFCLFQNSFAQKQNELPETIFHPDSIKAIVEVLASDSLEGRFTGSSGCIKAAAFIATEFQKAGLKSITGLEGFFMPVTSGWGNVVGGLQGKTKSDEVIIFSAHYDHIGTINTNPYPNLGGNASVRPGDGIYNGANDNASGVGAMITLAKYFAKQKNNERTILFIAFAGEEQGLLGSKHFASICEADSIKAVVNLEMLGSKWGKSNYPFITGAEYSDFIEILNNRLHRTDPDNYKKNHFREDRFFDYNLFMRSDNLPFAQIGIPAHTIMGSVPTDPFYHSLSDEADILDYKFINNVIKAIAIAIQGLTDGSDTPTRIISPKILNQK